MPGLEQLLLSSQHCGQQGWMLWCRMLFLLRNPSGVGSAFTPPLEQELSTEHDEHPGVLLRSDRLLENKPGN